MNDLLSIIKQASKDVVLKDKQRKESEQKKQNEEDSVVAQAAFDRLKSDIKHTESVSGFFNISMNDSHHRIDFLKILLSKLEAEGFARQQNAATVFEVIHPEVTGFRIWCISNTTSYGNVTSNSINYSFI